MLRSQAPMIGSILTLNAGSSSFEFAVFGQDTAGTLTTTLRGQVAGIGAAQHPVAHDAAGIELANRPNEAIAVVVSQPRSRVEVRMVATDKEAMIARHTKTAVERVAAA